MRVEGDMYGFRHGSGACYGAKVDFWCARDLRFGEIGADLGKGGRFEGLGPMGARGWVGDCEVGCWLLGCNGSVVSG